MAGTLANPVMLDQFQAITEVGWGGADYVAFRLTLTESREYSSHVPCSSPMAMPPGAFHDVHLTSASYDYAGGRTVQETAIYRNGGWVSKDVEVNGMPADPGSFTYVDWQTIASPPIQGHGRWVDFGEVFVAGGSDASSDAEILTPDGDSFLSGIPTFEIYGDTFIGSPFCGDLSRLWAEATNTNDESISPTPFPPDSVRAVYGGREFRPVAAALSGESQPDTPGTVWVLCEPVFESA